MLKEHDITEEDIQATARRREVAQRALQSWRECKPSIGDQSSLRIAARQYIDGQKAETDFAAPESVRRAVVDDSKRAAAHLRELLKLTSADDCINELCSLILEQLES